MDIIFSLDLGSLQSGYVIWCDGKLEKGGVEANEAIFGMIDRWTMFMDEVRLLVLYEDIRPYTVRFNMDVINTIKVIGRLEYVLTGRNVRHLAVTRYEVKRYVFDTFGDALWDKLVVKVARKQKAKERLALKSGEAVSEDKKPRKPSFHYVDDRIVINAMYIRWQQKKPKPGKTNPIGLRSHAWQALGVLSYYLDSIMER
jgi:hypothetical protein